MFLEFLEKFYTSYPYLERKFALIKGLYFSENYH